MARTVGQVILAARAIIQDERAPFRVSNDSMALYVTEALSEARRLRPDLFLTTLRDPIPLYTAVDLALTVPLPDMAFPQVVNYVAGRTDLREDTFSQDGRALLLMQAFGVSLTGGKQQ
ncbi:MAG: hypothetical protein ACK5PF_11890 [bacterium]